jgi:hypothetical protein
LVDGTENTIAEVMSVFRNLIRKLIDFIFDFNLVEQPVRTLLTGAGIILLGALLLLPFGGALWLMSVGIMLIGIVFAGVGVWYLPEGHRQRYREYAEKKRQVPKE